MTVPVTEPARTRRAAGILPAARPAVARRPGETADYRENVLASVSWLIRVGAYVAVGISLHHASFGPLAGPLCYAGYLVCGVLLTLRVLQVRWGVTGPSVPALLAATAALASAVAVQPGAGSVIVVGVVVMIQAGAEVDIATGWIAYGAGALGCFVGTLVSGAPVDGSGGRSLLINVGVLGFGLLAGFNRRSHRVQAEQNAALAARAEELRAEQRRTAVLDERARLAREIHDVLAHSLGALGIQIQTARALLESGAETGRVDGVLASAQRLASDGLTETRRAVHALRRDPGPLPDELAELAEVHEQRFGTRVGISVTGDPVPLPPDQSLALLRTAQESLTNAAKHAADCAVDIALDYHERDVTMTVTNPLGSRGELATLDGGFGLTGMRERLLLLGGGLQAGGDGGGNWTVTATVPR